MEHSEHSKKKAIWIISFCILLVVIFSVYILIKTIWPGKGLPFEEISMEQAQEYMEYEEGYILADVRPRTAYEQGHIKGALCVPYPTLEETAKERFQDPEQMIYVYSGDVEESRQAAALLCKLGYTNVTEIGSIADWLGETEK